MDRRKARNQFEGNSMVSGVSIKKGKKYNFSLRKGKQNCII